MCNALHARSRKEKSTGIGYKLVNMKSGKLSAFYTDAVVKTDEKMVWDDSFFGYTGKAKHGFCFFLSMDDLMEFIEVNCRYSGYEETYHIAKIRYSKCLGSNRSKSEMAGIRFGLCREYQVLNVYKMEEKKI